MRIGELQFEAKKGCATIVPDLAKVNPLAGPVTAICEPAKRYSFKGLISPI